MLTDSDKIKLAAYTRGLGIMDAAEAMAEAIWNDTQASLIQKGDAAYTRYRNESDHYLNYAELLEKQS